MINGRGPFAVNHPHRQSSLVWCGSSNLRDSKPNVLQTISSLRICLANLCHPLRVAAKVKIWQVPEGVPNFRSGRAKNKRLGHDQQQDYTMSFFILFLSMHRYIALPAGAHSLISLDTWDTYARLIQEK